METNIFVHRKETPLPKRHSMAWIKLDLGLVKTFTEWADRLDLSDGKWEWDDILDDIEHVLESDIAHALMVPAGSPIPDFGWCTFHALVVYQGWTNAHLAYQLRKLAAHRRAFVCMDWIFTDSINDFILDA